MKLNFDKVCHYFNRKCDPSSLAFTRIIIGLLLLIDIVYERGLSRADVIWGDPKECRFPLFNGLTIPPLKGMYAIYALMFIGNIGIILGLKYRLSCVTYLLCYWYIFMLDKSRWNNHSYLFGLLVSLLSISDANSQWSLDNALSKKSLEKRSVPFWQYFLLRSQIFLVYFIAGLKKMDLDWLKGYSMYYLSDHWVFAIFRFIIPNEYIDFFIVHWGGFIFDLTIGFFLINPKTRCFAYIFCALFNLMNSQIFSIGMFPYMMIAVMPIFSAPDWPKSLLKVFQNWRKSSVSITKEQKSEKNPKNELNSEVVEKSTTKQKLTLLLVLVYILLQLFLPHSHWVTKGYNTWTNGLYGYSWDMMVHNWKHIHTRVTVIDESMRKFYLKPEAWTRSVRWVHHSDMVKQFANCAQKHLYNDFNITNPSIYVDAWISLNGRFAQRVYDPRVDIVTAEWSPFKKPHWVLPLLTQLTDWRQKLKQFEQSIYQQNNYTSVIFIADFPGLTLNNYISSDFDNTTLKVLKGWIKIEIEGLSTRIMSSGDQINIPSEIFHKITAFKSEPTCYMFVFENNTHRMINNDYENKFLSRRPQSDLMDFNSMIGKNNFTKNEHNLKEMNKEMKNVWLVSLKFICEGLMAIIELINEIVFTPYQRLFIN